MAADVGEQPKTHDKAGTLEGTFIPAAALGSGIIAACALKFAGG